MSIKPSGGLDHSGQYLVTPDRLETKVAEVM